MRLHIFGQRLIIAIYSLTYVISLASLDPTGLYVTVGMIMLSISTFLSNLILPNYVSNINVSRGLSKAFMGLFLANILLLFHNPYIILLSSFIAFPSSLSIYYLGYYNVKHNDNNRENGLRKVESMNNLGYIIGYILGFLTTNISSYLLSIYLALGLSLLFSSFSSSLTSLSPLNIVKGRSVRLFFANMYAGRYSLGGYNRQSFLKITSLFKISGKYKRMVIILALINASVGFSYTYLTPYLVLNGVTASQLYLLTLIAMFSTYISTQLSTKVYEGVRSIPKMLLPRLFSYVSTLLIITILFGNNDLILYLMYIPIGFSWGFILALYAFLTSRVAADAHSKINMFTGLANLISVVIAGIIFYSIGLYLDLLLSVALISLAIISIYKDPYVIKNQGHNQHFIHIYLNRINRAMLRRKVGSRF